MVSVGGLILTERGLNTTSAMSPELLEHHLGGVLEQPLLSLSLSLSNLIERGLITTSVMSLGNSSS